MKLARLILMLAIGFSTFCFVTVTQARIPVWSLTPDTTFSPKASVTSTGIAIVKYTVINNSSKPHTLAILPQTGVSQNGGVLSIGPKSTAILILTIMGSALPASGFSGGPVLCQTNPGGIPNPNQCYQPSSPADSLAITIVPHNLSMLPIPIQEATANRPFVYNLKSAVNFYDENAGAGKPAQGVVSPAEQDGLHFDQASFSIIGTPKRTGTYLFKVGAQNAYGTAEPVDFQVQAQINEKEKPVLKQNYPIASALPEQKYSMNLLELVEPQTGFMVTNQLSFEIDSEYNNADWLHIAQEDSTLLEGKVPSNAAGQEVTVTLFANSNTGGRSNSVTIKIPIAYDPEKKPVINPFGLEKLVGTTIYEDLSGYINDPAHDSNLKVILEKVEPEASWLRISSLNSTVLEGSVPDKVTGQLFKLTLRASTPIGGSSDPVIIPLQISVRKDRTPGFKEDNPIFPLIYPGQAFFYDFVANRDIYPEYDDAPYEIKFADDYKHPGWLRLEDNKFIADEVPDTIDSMIEVYVTIKNVPGGQSHVIALMLTVMH